MLTEYRIIPYEEHGVVDLYLQFKTVHQITKYRKSFLFFQWDPYPVEEEVWRFIPEKNRAAWLGECLSQDACPIDRGYPRSRFIHEFCCREHRLRSFVSQYPDIEAYFEEIKLYRVKYLDEKEVERRTPVIYLNGEKSHEPTGRF